MSVRLKNLKTNKYICYKDDVEYQVMKVVNGLKVNMYFIHLFLIYFVATLFIGFSTMFLEKNNIDSALFIYLEHQALFTILYLIFVDLYFWSKSNEICYKVNYSFNEHIRNNDQFEYVDKNGFIVRHVEIPVGFIECSMSEIANLYYRLKNISGKYNDLIDIKL